MTGSRNYLHAWLLLLPACVLLAAFTHMPIVTTFLNSFYSTPRPRRPSVFVGLDNYEAILADPVFWKSLWNNAIYALTSVPVSVMIAMLMALLVNGKLRGKGFVRLSYFTPTVLPMIAVANIWLFFYNPQYGLIDQLLKPFGIVGITWLGSQSTALWSLIVVAVWKEAGFFMIFYLAALQNMSPDLREAAAIEGAGRWGFFWRVTFPLLMPTTLFVMINAVINAFRLVDHIFVMTGGGPDNSTSVMLYHIYVVGFRFFDRAQAATLTVVLLVILALIAIGQFLLTDKRVHYE